MIDNEEMYEFLLHGGSIKQLVDLAYKRGFDNCHNQAMKYLVKEGKK
jgi:hypothetical protein